MGGIQRGDTRRRVLGEHGGKVGSGSAGRLGGGEGGYGGRKLENWARMSGAAQPGDLRRLLLTCLHSPTSAPEPQLQWRRT